MLLSYSYQCLSCEHIFAARSSYQDRLLPKLCPECGQSNSEQVWVKMPGITRASYIDGRKTEANEDLKAVAKLEVEKAGMRPEERKTIQKEINERRKVKQ